MLNPEYVFKGTAHKGPYVELDKINLDRSQSFLMDDQTSETFVEDDKSAKPAEHELNCFGIDPNEF